MFDEVHIYIKEMFNSRKSNMDFIVKLNNLMLDLGGDLSVECLRRRLEYLNLNEYTPYISLKRLYSTGRITNVILV